MILVGVVALLTWCQGCDHDLPDSSRFGGRRSLSQMSLVESGICYMVATRGDRACHGKDPND